MPGNIVSGWFFRDRFNKNHSKCDKTNCKNETACYERVSNYHFMSGTDWNKFHPGFHDQKLVDSEESLISTLRDCCTANGYGFAPSWIENEGQGTRDKVYKAMSDYVETYGYKPESFAAI